MAAADPAAGAALAQKKKTEEKVVGRGRAMGRRRAAGGAQERKEREKELETFEGTISGARVRAWALARSSGPSYASGRKLMVGVFPRHVGRAGLMEGRIL